MDLNPNREKLNKWLEGKGKSPSTCRRHLSCYGLHSSTPIGGRVKLEVVFSSYIWLVDHFYCIRNNNFSTFRSELQSNKILGIKRSLKKKMSNLSQRARFEWNEWETKCRIATSLDLLVSSSNVGSERRLFSWWEIYLFLLVVFFYFTKYV